MRKRNFKNTSIDQAISWFFSSSITIIILCCLFLNTTSQCPENCQTCSNPTSCTSCTTQKNLLMVSGNLGCLPCPVRCERCLSQSDLVQCMTCSQGYYFDPYLQSCVRCKSPNCLHCNEYFPSQCQLCQTSYFLEESTSSCKLCASQYNWARNCRENFILTCQDGYFTTNGHACLECDLNRGCRTCVSGNVCSQCFAGFYLLSGRCLPCDLSCRTCNTNTSCTSCPRGFRVNTSSKCQACTISNCEACNIQDVCQQCHSSYYLETSNRTCLVLNINRTVQNCIRYASNFNNSITGIYTATTILCRACANGTYLNLQTNSCQGCSLLCEICVGMHRSSRCLSCNSTFAWLVDSVNGICGAKLYTEEGQKVVYVNGRNEFEAYVRNGKTVSITEGVLKCPGGLVAEQVSLNLANIVGHQYRVNVKLLIHTNNPPPFNISVLLNSRLISLQSIDSTSECNSLKISSFSFTFSAQSLAFSTSPSPIYTTQPNKLNFKSNQPQNMLIDVREIVILIKECHQSCALCETYETCVQCKVDSHYLEKEKCVNSCHSGYFLFSSKKMCLLECPRGTFPLIISTIWKCELCHSSCLSCISSAICTSCTTGFYLHQSQCLTSCPQKFFGNSLFRKCQQCITPCDTCTSIRQCLSCQVGFYLSSSHTCVEDCPNGFYGNFQLIECKPCEQPCSKCRSRTSCLDCTASSNLSYLGFQCLSICPSKHFPVLNSYNQSICQFCGFPCQQCSTSPTTCSKCITGFLLSSNDTCVASCPSGYFSSITFSICLPCSAPCHNCLHSERICTSCISGYLLMESKCVASCEDGFFKENQKQCIVCKDDCTTCVSYDNCTGCVDDYFLQGTNCLSECTDGYYKTLGLQGERLCVKCSDDCRKCFGQANYCLACYPNYLLQPNNTCSSTCKTNQLAPGCSSCESPCFGCSVSTNNCTSCVNSYFIAVQTSECVTECHFGFYKSIQKGFGHCLPCNPPCASCQSPSICHSCSQINGKLHYLRSYSPARKVCVEVCGHYQYKDDSQLVCLRCKEPCLACANSSFCLSCVNGILVNGTCGSKIDGCPIGTYQIQTTKQLAPELTTTLSTCLPCPFECSSCKSPTMCTGCIQDFYLHGYSCLSYCPSGSALVKQLRQCIFCEYPCSECQGTFSNCTKCSQMLLNSTAVSCPQDRQRGAICIKYYMSKGECTAECSPGSFPSAQKCVTCATPCQTCTSQTTCTSCIKGFYMLKNTCYSACPQDYYTQPLTQQCERCVYPCKSCYSQNQCLSCQEGYLFGNQCLIKEACPVGYFQGSQNDRNKLCKKCNSQCLACTNTKDYCLECSKMASYEGKCYDKCPFGYFSHINTSSFNPGTVVRYCATCPSECLTCTGSQACSSCVYSYSLLDGNCVKRCPPTFMQNFTTIQFTPTTQYTISQCSACIHPCTSCFLQQALCESCQQGYYMHERTCLLACPNGTYLNRLTQSCRVCPLPCKFCKEKDRDIVCLECERGHYEYRGVCVDRCSGNFIDFDGRSCVQDCVGGYTVQHILTKSKFCARDCQLPYLKDQSLKKCVTECPQGKYMTAKYECEAYNDQICTLIPRLKGHLFVDRVGILNLNVQITRSIEYTDTQPIQENIEINIVDMSSSPVFYQNISHSPSSPFHKKLSSHSIKFILTSQSQSQLIFSLYPSIPLMYPSFLSLNFKFNSHLYIIDRISKLPLESSHLDIELRQGDFYELYDYGMMKSNRFMYVGEILMDFVLILGLVMLAFNQFTKLYHLIIFCQSVFMLVCLDIPTPPNLYRFLQGFRFAHLYQIPNWFDSIQPTQHYTDFHANNFNRIQSIFGDLAFVRVAGHVIGLYCIFIALSLFLYGVRYLPEGRNDYVRWVREIMVDKSRCIKWSHMTDVFVSTFTLTLAAFFFQTLNYAKVSTQQSISIALSYLTTLPLLVYCVLFTYRTYTLHQQSLNSPQQFVRSRYLLREQYVPFYEGITSTHQSYKNYMIVGKMLAYGIVTGVVWRWPNLCLAGWIVGELVCAGIYVWWKPFADDVQNYLYGVVGTIYAGTMVLLIVINQSYKLESQFYLPEGKQSKKMLLGYMIIILLLLCTFLLIIETIISVIRGSLKPKRLQGENEDYNQVLSNSPNSLQISPGIPGPKRIEFQAKPQLTDQVFDVPLVGFRDCWIKEE